MSQRRTWPLLLAAGLLTSVLSACGDVARERPEPIRVRIGIPHQPTSVLAFIAHDRGLFREQNLDVELHTYPSGKQAIVDGLEPGRLDVAVAADVPVVMLASRSRRLRILASIYLADNVNRVVARRAAGIARSADLRGKRIGTQHGSAVHFFQYALLEELGIGDDYRSEFLPVEQLVPALVDGRIDAFSMREPYVSAARRTLGERVAVFAAPGLYPQVELLVADPAWLGGRPERGRRLIRALLAAERIYRDDPEGAYAMAALRLGTTPEQIAASLQGLPRVALEQAMVQQLEGIFRWARRSGLTHRSLPYFLDLIEPGPLAATGSQRINLIH